MRIKPYIPGKIKSPGKIYYQQDDPNVGSDYNFVKISNFMLKPRSIYKIRYSELGATKHVVYRPSFYKL